MYAPLKQNATGFRGSVEPDKVLFWLVATSPNFGCDQGRAGAQFGFVLDLWS